ncbi:MAG: DUF2163 domain-containing protein [Rhodobacteraceae bacterium]|nr:DUF2163 domain-containing protein [Paracoccaceae bacterium]
MTGLSQEFQAHLQSGATTVARAWWIARSDGHEFGFTDHDRPLRFAGRAFSANPGLSAQALEQVSGLAVDNTQALGVLSDTAISAADIKAGRYDNTRVKAWLVNWADPRQHALLFHGTLGEVRCVDGVFYAELRGLSEALNRPMGRVYQKSCPAVLGDSACGVRLDQTRYSVQYPAEAVQQGRMFLWRALTNYADGWFRHGKLEVLDGKAAGLGGVIKRDYRSDGQRVIELWAPIRSPIAKGDRIRLVAGCDKRLATCLAKFGNHLNFQGFPHIPGDDWMVAHPTRLEGNSGESLRR